MIFCIGDKTPLRHHVRSDASEQRLARIVIFSWVIASVAIFLALVIQIAVSKFLICNN